MSYRSPVGVMMLALMVVFAGAALAAAPIAFGQTSYTNNYEYYEQQQKSKRNILVTSDSVLHTAHILFDYTLRAAELKHFDGNLRALTDRMSNSTASKAIEESQINYFMQPPPFGYTRVAAYCWVARMLLDPTAKAPALVQPLVEQELALINAADNMAPSPIMGVIEDYTQYVPRGHYTRSETFKRYFRAMMWYGRAGFVISGEKSPGVPLSAEEKRENALAGLTLARSLHTANLAEAEGARNNLNAFDLWNSIYQPTEFIVGASDDLTPSEYLELANKVFGETLPGGWTEDAKTKTDQFIAAAVQYRKPRILGTLQTDEQQDIPVALRFFGQRYIPDSMFFQQLVHDNVPGRYLPSGLDVMAVLGSQAAEGLLQGEFNHPEYGLAYAGQMAMLRANVVKMSEDDWRKTAYLLWMKSLQELAADPALTGQPNNRVMPEWWCTPEWQAKQLNAALGSWAELRHDTILYAKQAYTLRDTAIMPPANEPVVYVEPVPEVYGRIAQMIITLRSTLRQQRVFPEEMAQNFTRFEELLQSLRIISYAETPLINVDDLPRTPDTQDWARVTAIGSTLRQIETLPTSLRDPNAPLANKEDEQMACIADVHTDPNDKHVLEVGVGKVAEVWVTMKIGAQEVRLSGPIFSYYEFKQPMDKRLTDGEWQEMLRTNPLLRPLVISPFIAYN